MYLSWPCSITHSGLFHGWHHNSSMYTQSYFNVCLLTGALVTLPPRSSWAPTSHHLPPLPRSYSTQCGSLCQNIWSTVESLKGPKQFWEEENCWSMRCPDSNRGCQSVLKSRCPDYSVLVMRILWHLVSSVTWHWGVVLMWLFMPSFLGRCLVSWDHPTRAVSGMFWADALLPSSSL